MPGDDVLAGVPVEVVRVQEAIAARSRLVILRLLLEGPATFGELNERVGLSTAGVRAGLTELTELGYVANDSPAGRQRMATTARFRVDRELVLRDLMALVLFLAR